MKKLSLFLSALLISMMSFAQTPVYELVPTSGSNKGYAGNCDVEIGGITWNLTGNSTMQPWRIGGKSLTNADRALYSKTAMPYNISKIEVTHGTASSITVNSFKLIVSDEANGAGTEIDVTFKASATTTIELPAGDYTNKYFKFLYNVTVSGSNNKYLQFSGAKFYAAVSDDMATTPEITGDEHFIASTEVTIQAEDGLKVYYTLDGTEPTNASTEYTAPFTVEETTTVKAIAYDGEKKSYVASATFTKATAVTCVEAAELAMKVASNNALTSVHYVIVGYVTEVIDQALSNGQQRFWVADTRDGGQVLQSYYCNVPQVLKVGDKVQMFGQLTKYNTTPQMKNGEVTLLPADLTGYIGCNNLDFGVVAVNSEVEAKTLTVTAENLTAEITATLDNENFTVTPATLPAAGGDLTITPATDLAAGEHTATLTLTSGDVTKEVALSILVKDVYAIEWYVNGKLYEETTVIEGAALALPEAPEAPEACSEKVFVGWTAAEEVNADGSEIEWATAATVPTTDTTYYAVFAVQEGEGGAAEEGTVTLAYTGTTTGNMDLEANNAAAVGLDETKWNVIATKGDNSNAPGLNKSGDIRIYYGDPTSNTITVTSLDETVTISTIVITYTGDTYSNGKILVNDAVVTGTNGTYEINANSFTITNGNTSNIQVRLKNIVINYTAGAAATYSEYSTVCESDVVEPTTITWELNGGELPAVVVPTNAELWEAFKPYYNTYYGLTRADQPIDKVSTFAATYMQEIMTDEASEYKWLGDYVQSVATAAGVPLSTDMAAANEGGWRWAVHAFFNAAAGQYGAAGIDFTEAGKPEAWGAAYEAEYGVVLPTEPVEEDYVLPTPTKTGYEFVGWYDNAEGTGEAMTVLPAGWVGTLYAIWKESSTTGVDNNIIAEQAVKVIRNGQVLIMIGEKTFNIMGQQVK